MEKRNVVDKDRTPVTEFTRPDENWDKRAASKFKTPNTKDDKSRKPEKL